MNEPWRIQEIVVVYRSGKLKLNDNEKLKWAVLETLPP